VAASVEFQVAIKGDLEKFMADLVQSKKKVATNVNRKAARRTRRNLRKEIQSAFDIDRASRRASGMALEDTVRVADTPRRGYAFENMSVVYSKATYAKGRAAKIDLLSVFETGATIRARGGNWVAIPTDDAPLRAGRGGARRATPDEYPGPKQFIQIRPGLAIMVDPRRRLVLWILVPAVRVKKRLNVAAIHGRTVAIMGRDYENLLTAETARLIQKYGFST
jgi:hypothetical protein